MCYYKIYFILQGFCDSRAEIKILRPMRDISHEELQHYIRVKELVCNNFSCTESKNSLQNVIKNFVVDLQDNFQSTISTVCKTADKIGVNDGPKNDNKCLLCEVNTYAQLLIYSYNLQIIFFKICTIFLVADCYW